MRSKYVWQMAVLSLTVAARARAADGTATMVGNPQWQPIGFVLFSGPIGTPADNFADFYQTQANILPPPKYQLNPTNGEFVPGTPTPGPYGQDMVNGVVANHYKTGSISGSTFTPADFSNGNAIWLAFMMTPLATAPTGSSPNFTSGLIMPNALFDTGAGFTQTGLTQRNGLDFDGAWSFTFGDINAAMTGLTTKSFDGYSNIPQFEAEAADFGPTDVLGNLIDPVTGHYNSTWQLRDSGGNGWNITTSYLVAVPEPTSLGLLIVGGALLSGYGGRNSTSGRRSVAP